METGNYNIVSLLKVLYDGMQGVSDNIFTTNRPKSTDNMKDFVVVSFPVRIIDDLGYGYTTCRISIYAKDNSNGENLPLLSSLQNKVYERLPISSDVCTIIEPVPINAGSDDLGFHCIHIQCTTIIN